ncbi:MAG: hypothetical protein U0871_17750 [Gemmataceae bacterium]
MTRFARPLAVALLASVALAGCGEETKPTGKDAPPPTEKQLQKEGPRAGGGAGPKSK